MIRLIAALDRQHGIAKQGFRPWLIPEDEQYFAQQTKSHGGHILVGGITFRTLKGPFADRENFVLTRDKEPIDGATLVHDLDQFLKEYKDQDLWVIGGADVFAQVMESGHANELYLTHIEADFGCNQFFPTYETAFQLAERSDLHEQNGFIFSFARYVKQA